MKKVMVGVKVLLVVAYAAALIVAFYFMMRIVTAMTTEVDDYICSTHTVTIDKTVLGDCAPRHLNEEKKSQ